MKIWKYLVLMIMLFTSTALAEHAWGTYHWARSSSPLVLELVDSVTPAWETELEASRYDWSLSGTLDLLVVAGSDKRNTRKRCKPISGKVRVCNDSYGRNGWLGLATIWIDSDGHITQGTSKLNDSYPSYWEDLDYKRHVMCQEIGHTFGLGHTSEDGSSQGTCMDYSQSPDSVSPNAHDYEMLAQIYNHLEEEPPPEDNTGCNAPPGRGCNKAGPWGHLVNAGRHHETYIHQGPDGSSVVRHLYLAP